MDSSKNGRWNYLFNAFCKFKNKSYLLLKNKKRSSAPDNTFEATKKETYIKIEPLKKAQHNKTESVAGSV